MHKYKILFVTPYYRYPGDINSSLNTQFIDYLNKTFISSVVLTSKESEFEGKSIIRPKNSFIWRIIIKVAQVFSFSYKFGLLPDLFYWIWGKTAMKEGVKYLKINRINCIHSISIPYSSHLIANNLKKIYNVPWIAHFYEPWCDNTYRKSTPYVMKKNEEWEKEVALNADIIIHNSVVMCEKWRERYGKLVERKLFYLPMPLTNVSEKISKVKGEKLVISHIGNFYGIRNSTVFLEALNSCLNNDASLRNKLKINFIGLYTDLDIETVNKYHLNDIVQFVGKISEEECVEYYNNSDVFLVIEGKDQGPLFFPSKLIKYFYYEKPIIGITEKGSVLDKLLRDNGHHSYTHNNIKGIAEYIGKSVTSYDSLLSFNKDAWKEYEISNVVKIYKSIVDKLFKNHNNVHFQR